MPDAKKPAKKPAADRCPHCGSTEDPYWSRIVPMGYFCPDCGKDQNEKPMPTVKRTKPIPLPLPFSKGPWVAHCLNSSPCKISAKSELGENGHALAKVFLTDPKTKKRTTEFVANMRLVEVAPKMAKLLQQLAELEGSPDPTTGKLAKKAKKLLGHISKPLPK